jgi:pre-peptidase
MAYRRVYAISFEGEAGQEINITARDFGGAFTDPLIALLGPDGEPIAGDDDFGGGLDSEIDNFELPEDGTYTLLVSHAEGGYDFGFQGIVRVDIDG